MQLQCLNCHAEFDGEYGKTLCAKCAAESIKSVVRQRTCIDCGAFFLGGPRAWRCPGCRAIRTKQTQSEAQKRRAMGTTRKLGSTDLCQRCGQAYTVTGGLQKYCPVCAPEAVAEIDREQGKRWNQANITPAQKRQKNAAAKNKIPCAICGKLFLPRTSQTTCSELCRKKAEATKAKEYQQTHKAELAEYNRQRYQLKRAGVSPNNIPCVVCGKMFKQTSRTNTCSLECRATRRKAMRSKYMETYVPPEKSSD